jgi:hypothetical protein
VKSRDQTLLLGKHTAPITGAAWVSSGPAIFAVNDSGALMRYTDFKPHSGAQSSDSASERKYEAAADHVLYCMTASADAQRVFAGSHDGQIVGWNKDGKITIKLSIRPAAATAAK